MFRFLMIQEIYKKKNVKREKRRERRGVYVELFTSYPFLIFNNQISPPA